MIPPRSEHRPVLLDEVLHWLVPRPGHVFVDGTLGGGGHTRAIAERVAPHGMVIALDRDPAAVAAGHPRLAGLPVRVVQANYCDLPEVLAAWEIALVDGVLLDLGLSSDQLADRERGFSFDAEGPLDLRFDPHEGQPARDLVNRFSERALADLIYANGEERMSRRIARRIVEERKRQRIETARQLAEIVRGAVPRVPSHRRLDPATRTFQALRIAVNDELGSLESGLKRVPDCLRPGGRLAVISFHSLEDRRVKEAFRGDPRYQVLTKKPIRPSEREAAENPRSRSAKLRVAARSTHG
ncbi:MAG: 16S rRNA (cytosine(1402)-N(4))-methyltransferase RsmH [Planctomycetia bacterium]|nr:16S rRNA (cytosine(1402)-N(4))-methyltransferase RsmH [Planctomycetia bacterium]